MLLLPSTSERAKPLRVACGCVFARPDCENSTGMRQSSQSHVHGSVGSPAVLTNMSYSLAFSQTRCRCVCHNVVHFPDAAPHDAPAMRIASKIVVLQSHHTYCSKVCLLYAEVHL